jgi:hypothetical protein
MTRKDDSPSLILRLVGRGKIIPATAVDEELLDGFRAGTDFMVKEARKPRSPGLAAWWQLIGAVAAYSDDWHAPRALSNALLLKMNLYETELLIGGKRNTPMSLTEFTEDELFRLVEAAKLIIAIDITPGVDPDLLIEEKKRGSF